MLRVSTLLVLISASVFQPVWAEEPALLPADRPIEQVIDHYISDQLKAESITPAPQAEDAAILRRLTLDLAGRIPTLTEMTAYLADPDSRKKHKLIERLLASPGFVRHQATELFTLLQPEDVARKGKNKGALRDYLVQSVTDNRPWNQIFRELMLPDDADPKTKGASEFLKARVKDHDRLTIDVSSIFFGVNVSCAQCHDHPLVLDWKQDHFYGLKSFFARTVDASGFIAERDFGLVKFTPHKGVEKVAPVMFLTGKTITAPGVREPNKEEKKRDQDRIDEAKKTKKAPAPPEYSLRAKLVETALEPSQRDFFAKAIVNRIWHRLLGRGLVMPLDQMHSANPPSHPELLAWLARDFAETGYDLRRLIRGIVSSETYSRSSRWPGERPPQDRFFAVAQVRALTPTQMAVALKLAAVDPSGWPAESSALEQRLEALEKSAEGLAKYFPQPGENFQVGVAEAMLFANNEPLQKDLLQGSSSLASQLHKEKDAARRADLAVRVVLNRSARPEEIAAINSYLQDRGDRLEAACQQVVWALMTSAEFRFNH